MKRNQFSGSSKSQKESSAESVWTESVLDEKMSVLLQEKHKISTKDLEELRILLREGADPNEAVELLKLANTIKYIPTKQKIMEEEPVLAQFMMILQMYLSWQKRMEISQEEDQLIENIKREFSDDAAKIAAL